MRKRLVVLLALILDGEFEGGNENVQFEAIEKGGTGMMDNLSRMKESTDNPE